MAIIINNNHISVNLSIFLLVHNSSSNTVRGILISSLFWLYMHYNTNNTNILYILLRSLKYVRRPKYKNNSSRYTRTILIKTETYKETLKEMVH